MPPLLLCQHKQGYEFPLEPLDLLGGGNNGGAAIDVQEGGFSPPGCTNLTRSP
jgi:hypothetical protein